MFALKPPIHAMYEGPDLENYTGKQQEFKKLYPLFRLLKLI